MNVKRALLSAGLALAMVGCGSTAYTADAESVGYDGKTELGTTECSKSKTECTLAEKAECAVKKSECSSTEKKECTGESSTDA